MQLQLTPVRVGQLPEGVPVAGARTGQDLLGRVRHARILIESSCWRHDLRTSRRLEIRRSILVAADA
jgi:hypothetical protein